MVLGYELMAAYKLEAAKLRDDISVLLADLMQKAESVQEDCSPEIYKDYKQLKSDIAAQKEENALLQKTLMQVQKETADQRERVALCSERILIMEE